MGSNQWIARTALFILMLHATTSLSLAQGISSDPDIPFKLLTFQVDGEDQLGMLLGDRILDIKAASDFMVAKENLSITRLPEDMLGLIEEYSAVKGRLYQIANYFGENAPQDDGFAFDVDEVSIQAPVKYPWNILAVAANYKAHAVGMRNDVRGEDEGQPAATPRPRGGFDPSRIADIVPERDAPVIFAKSPRSCIIGTGEPYYVLPGRERIDWEGEMAIVIGKPAYLVSNEDAHDYVFGYSIMYDVSDRGGRVREVSMFPGPNWFDSKSTNRCAPFGPYIVPKEFLEDHDSLRLATKVNGEVMQDQTTADLIWNEANLIRYTTSILELYPGDVISTGTPSGTGAERGTFLKAGDVVTIELEGVGTLETPIEAYEDRSNR